MEIQLRLILTIFFFYMVSLVQSQDPISNLVQILSFYDAKNDTNQTYLQYLRLNAEREQIIFNKMKEELWIAQDRNAKKMEILSERIDRVKQQGIEEVIGFLRDNIKCRNKELNCVRTCLQENATILVTPKITTPPGTNGTNIWVHNENGSIIDITNLGFGGIIRGDVNIYITNNNQKGARTNILQMCIKTVCHAGGDSDVLRRLFDWLATKVGVKPVKG